MNSETRKCSACGVVGKYYCRGFCKSCYGSKLLSGQLQRVTCSNVGQTCSIPGCGRPAQWTMLCHSHYAHRKDDPYRRIRKVRPFTPDEDNTLAPFLDPSPGRRKLTNGTLTDLACKMDRSVASVSRRMGRLRKWRRNNYFISR